MALAAAASEVLTANFAAGRWASSDFTVGFLLSEEGCGSPVVGAGDSTTGLDGRLLLLDLPVELLGTGMLLKGFPGVLIVKEEERHRNKQSYPTVAGCRSYI